MNYNTTEMEMPSLTGGKKGKKTSVKYNKTDKENKDKCGTVRRVYEKNGLMYIKKKSPKTGAFVYYKVTSTR